MTDLICTLALGILICAVVCIDCVKQTRRYDKT